MSSMNYYKTLQEYKNKNQYLVMNEVTRDICLKKTLTVYDIEVFAWLKSHHPSHTPEILDYYEENGKLIVFEKYISGLPLDEYIRKNNPGIKQRVKILSEICDGLTSLHKSPRPIIHRDIKAQNIIIDANGSVTIVDFDAAKVYKNGESCDTVLLGTEGHAAPEQYGFAQSDPRTDVYGVGILAKEILPNKKPYSSIIQKATSMDPRFRYANTRQLKDALHGKNFGRDKAIVLGIVLTVALTIISLYLCLLSATITPARKAATNVLNKVSIVYTDGDYTADELEEIISSPDYSNAEEFEEALNNGAEVRNAIVRFEALDVHSRTAYGYGNIFAGAHLNFVSTSAPDVVECDILTVRICAVSHYSNHWFISYEILDVE